MTAVQTKCIKYEDGEGSKPIWPYRLISWDSSRYRITVLSVCGHILSLQTVRVGYYSSNIMFAIRYIGCVRVLISIAHLVLCGWLHAVTSGVWQRYSISMEYLLCWLFGFMRQKSKRKFPTKYEPDHPDLSRIYMFLLLCNFCTIANRNIDMSLPTVCPKMTFLWLSKCFVFKPQNRQ